MATEKPLFTDTFTASTALVAADKYRFVKLSSGKLVRCAAITDIPIGVLQEEPTGDVGALVMMAGLTKLQSNNAAIAADALVGTSSIGLADSIVAGTDTTVFVAGRALTAASSVNLEIIDVYINLLNPTRAA